MTFKEAWESDDEQLKADLKEACVQDLGYFVEPEYLYSTMISMIDRKENILPALERSLKKIEDSTIGQESEDDFGGLFSDIDLASPKLGRTADDKNRHRLRAERGAGHRHTGRCLRIYDWSIRCWSG